MKRTHQWLKHAIRKALTEMRARYLAAETAHQLIQARKEAEQLRLIRNGFHHFL